MPTPLEHPPESSLLTRIAVGLGAGFAGTIVLAIVLLLSWSIVGETLSPSEVMTNEFGLNIHRTKSHPLFLMIVTLAVFLATMTANVLHAILLTVVDERYHHQSTAVTHIFFGNLALLVLMLPAYVVSSLTGGPETVAVTGIMHGVVSGFATLCVLDALHQSRYLLLTIYGVLVGLIAFFTIGQMFGSDSSKVLSLFTLPLLHAMLGMGMKLTNQFSVWVYETYGSDFFSLDTRYGTDYGKKGMEEEF